MGDSSAFDAYAAGAKPLGGAGSVRDGHDQGAACDLLADDRFELLDAGDVQTGPRLVEQQHPRVVNQSAPQRNSLTLTSRQCSHRSVGERFGADARYHSFDSSTLRNAVNLRYQLDVAAARELSVAV